MSYTTKPMAGGGRAAIFSFALMASACGQQSGGASTDSAPAQAITVSVRKLEADYVANAPAAQAKYAGSRLRLSGTIQSVDLDIFNLPVIRLAAANQFLPATANLTESSRKIAKSLRKGESIALSCESVSRVVGMIQLASCEILGR